jgi:TetR/AcrR family transcriptional regulator, regulator of cefoperazone and chloramphenicol sensitivity
MTDQDHETRARLLIAAAALFAADGFSKVTVRDICSQAQANVAAVNYHFGGKTGLYDEVLRSAIAIMQQTTEEIRTAGEGRPPEQQLEAYIHVFLRRVAAAGDSWIHQLMLQEMSNPTPALDLVVEQVLRPRHDYVSGLIAAIIGCPGDDPRVIRCLMSVQAQLLALMKNPVAERLHSTVKLTPQAIEITAGHIARFSLAGIRAIATP